MKKTSRLHKAYASYQKKKITKKGILSTFRLNRPEIILRTTRLEGQSVTRKMVQTLFK